MTSLVELVMEAAAAELLHEEADQIEEEMQRLLSEVEGATVEDAHGVLWQHFMELLRRREEIFRKALILFKERRVLFEPHPTQHGPEHSQVA